MEKNILEKYKKFKVIYKLPHFSELETNFKIDCENISTGVIDHIRNEMSEKIFSVSERILEPIIGNFDSLSSVYEQDMIKKDEKRKLFNIYRKIQVLKWKNTMLMINPDDKESAKWIKDTWTLWKNELKTEVTILCKNMSVRWDTFESKKENPNYCG